MYLEPGRWEELLSSLSSYQTSNILYSSHPEKPGWPRHAGGLWYWIRWYLIDTHGPILQRLKLMVVALVAPELINGFAARQYVKARGLAQENNLSLTHGFFIVMGGFVDADGIPIAIDEQLSQPGVVGAIRAIPESALEDKSKGDVFSKGIALCQVLWFILQCIARRSQHLPLAELEIATLGFAVLNAVTWLLWIAKPLDVRDPILVPLPTQATLESRHGPIPPALPLHMSEAPQVVQTPLGGYRHQRLLRYLMLNFYHDFRPRFATHVPTFWRGYTDPTCLRKDMRFLTSTQYICGMLH
ncbi:hypothetical protein MIND_01421100 [Mycena indigotica]|uniref:Uncharacterized protein n=1 Tax=Mycena indigotica TaxID=2126181 RepID=A0A8H6RXL3_9AGAR|nr:uncharacterized protein MIND_01421100 [Mycena indigotica]KAF7288757.1 hypothetical protein MIND_01421100 [Mycena indigotica]